MKNNCRITLYKDIFIGKQYEVPSVSYIVIDSEKDGKWNELTFVKHQIDSKLWRVLLNLVK